MMILEWIIIIAGIIAYAGLGIVIYQSVAENHPNSDTATKIIITLMMACGIVVLVLFGYGNYWSVPTHQYAHTANNHPFSMMSYIILIVAMMIGVLLSTLGIRLISKYRAKNNPPNEDMVRRYEYISPFWQCLWSQYGIRGPDGLYRILFCAIYIILGSVAIIALLYFKHVQ